MSNPDIKIDEEVLKEDANGMKYKLNMPFEQYRSNVESSIRRQLPQAWPHQEQDTVIGLVGGGPSLDDQIDDIIEKHKNGMKFVSMNASHDFLLDHGIRPSVHVQIDGRAFNKRFVENWQEKTKYMIASQCAPEVFDTLTDAEVYLFHCICGESVVPKSTYNDYYMGNYVILPGGSTVMLRTIPLMRMLGYKQMEVFGFDSCITDNRHHAYMQEENDQGPVATIEVSGKEFFCFSWMVSQANDFIEMVKAIGNTFELKVHGDGLIAHILESSADKLEVK